MSERVLLQALLQECPPDSGVGYVVRNSGAAMEALGWRVERIVGDDVLPGVRGRQYAAVPAAIGWRVRKRLSELPADATCVVECHSAMVGLVPVVLGRMRRRAKVVFRGHGFWRAAVALAAADERGMQIDALRTLKSELTYGNLERIGVRASDGVVVQSLHDRRFAELVDGVPHDHVAIVAPGVEHPGAVPQPARDAPIELLWIGRASLVKGSDVIVDVARSVARRHDGNVRFTLVGLDVAAVSGPGVEVLPFVPRGELPRLFGRATAFLWTSRFEGFGLAPFEAMAHGVPVIATRVGGLEGVLEDGLNGLVAASVSPAAFLAQVERLLALSHTERAALRRGAHAAAATLTWESHARALDAFYRTLGGR